MLNNFLAVNLLFGKKHKMSSNCFLLFTDCPGTGLLTSAWITQSWGEQPCKPWSEAAGFSFTGGLYGPHCHVYAAEKKGRFA